MKLINNGKFWLWEKNEEETSFDEKVLDAQKKFNTTGRSIWGTEKCEMCGACCYKFQIASLKKEKNRNYTLCPYQIIEENSKCERHGKNKPRECRDYGCWKREYKRGIPAERYAMMLMAIEILHTKKESDLMSALELAEEIPPKT
jgi:hypothetical protein